MLLSILMLRCIRNMQNPIARGVLVLGPYLIQPTGTYCDASACNSARTGKISGLVYESGAFGPAFLLSSMVCWVHVFFVRSLFDPKRSSLEFNQPGRMGWVSGLVLESLAFGQAFSLSCGVCWVFGLPVELELLGFGLRV